MSLFRRNKTSLDDRLITRISRLEVLMSRLERLETNLIGLLELESDETRQRLVELLAQRQGVQDAQAKE